MGKYSQRDIVEVAFVFPDGKSKPHPGIIISGQELYEAEGFFYVVMMSTKNFFPEYTFPVTKDMVNGNVNKTGFVTCHLINSYMDRDVLGRHGSMKKEYFDKLVAKIKETIF